MFVKKESKYLKVITMIVAEKPFNVKYDNPSSPLSMPHYSNIICQVRLLWFAL